MTIKVHGVVLSGCTELVLAALHEKEVTDYELVHVDMMKGGHKMPDYLTLQPFGTVPSFEDGPLTLFGKRLKLLEFNAIREWIATQGVSRDRVGVSLGHFVPGEESRAIARYIADKYEGQGTPLYGATPKDRALVEQWLEVESQNFNPALLGIMREKFGKLFTGEKPDEEAVAANFKKLGQVLDVYEAHLSNNKYLAGDFFSLADLAHSPGLNHLNSTLKIGGGVVDSRPHVKAWWEDISSRPTWKKLAAEIGHEYAAFETSMNAR